MNRSTILSAALIAGLAVGAAVQDPADPPEPAQEIADALKEINASVERIGSITRSDRIRGELEAISFQTDRALRRVVYVTPEQVGAAAPWAQVMVQTFGFGIGPSPSGVVSIPLEAKDYMLGGKDGAVTSTGYGGAGAPLRWSNVRIHGFGETNNKWGTRAYDVYDWQFTRCTWDTLGAQPPATTGCDGHGFYGNAIGGVRWYECHFDNLTGQGIQVVYASPQIPGSPRAHETGLAPHIWRRLMHTTVQNEWHEVVRCAFEQVGDATKSERASYAISMFDPAGHDGPTGHAVRVIGCYMKTELPWTDPNGQERDCQGAIMAHKRRSVRIAGNYIEYKKGTRDVIQLWGCSDGVAGTEDVVLMWNSIRASQNIDIRLDTPEDTVVIESNRGTCNVVISTAPWYTWPPPPETVIYSGPVSDNYRLN